jgi:hypothetical protein
MGKRELNKQEAHLLNILLDVTPDVAEWIKQVVELVDRIERQTQGTSKHLSEFTNFLQHVDRKCASCGSISDRWLMVERELRTLIGRIEQPTIRNLLESLKAALEGLSENGTRQFLAARLLEIDLPEKEDDS